MTKLRKKDREIQIEEAKDLILKCEYGILSTVGADDQPYGVPLNYVYQNGAIYFHCAQEGHKIENIENNQRVSFCVVGDTHVLPEKFATLYESAVVFGVALEVHGTERNNALMWLLKKYSPDFIEEGKKYIKQKDKETKVIKIDITQINGKARKQ